MIIAILGIWKSGAAYVPIDPTFPRERVEFMLSDTKAKFIISNIAHTSTLQQQHKGLSVMCIEKLPLSLQPTTNLQTSVTSSDLAYAIYTSGTTGNPKAVLVEHKGVVNLQVSLSKCFDLHASNGSNEVILSFSNYVFDHFVEQMIDALLNGQTLLVLDDEMRVNKEQLYDYINKYQVTYLSGTPSVLSLYNFSSTPTLKRIDAIGEDFTEPVFDKIRSTFPGLIINGYGPTEISITSHKRLYYNTERRTNKSIGYPVANTTCYVLQMMKQVPIGGVGELYIGGVGVARGYLNRDDVTAYRFVPNPFQTSEEQQSGRNARLYRTGDLARWLPNGELEYLGRNDQQVKINGQRIEIAEVEAALAAFPDVAKAVVIAQEISASGNTVPQKHLVGFYVSDKDLVDLELKQWLRGKLPAAYVPSFLMRIKEVPVTINGKLDTKRLPTVSLAARSSNYVPPSTEVEIKLCQAWAAVLSIPSECISIHDDFFSLGGDSFLAIDLLHRANTSCHSSINLASIFRFTTISGLADHVSQSAGRKSLLDSNGTLRASLSQERLLFIHEFEDGSHAYNIPFVLCIPAPTAVIISSLQQLVQYHGALRTLLIRGADGLYYQHILSAQSGVQLLSIQEYKLKDKLELDARLERDAQHCFNLNSELPILLAVYTLDTKVFVSIVVHHSCFDGWSWGIFRRQLSMLVQGEQLLPSESTYHQYAAAQRNYLTGDVLSSLSSYWATTLETFETLELPYNFSRPPTFNYSGKELLFQIDSAVSNQLKGLATSTKSSLFSVLAAAYSIMLHMFSGQSDIIFGIPMANRGWTDFTEVIGFFTNLVPLRVLLKGTSSLREFIQSVGATAMQAQMHQEYPFEQLVKCLRVPPDASRHPIVQVVFNMLDSSIVGESTEQSTHLYTPDTDGFTTCKYDLSTTISEHPGGLTANFTYATALFNETTVSVFARCFIQILQKFATISSSIDSIMVLISV